MLVPATDPQLADARFRLGFGHQQALGLREVPAHVHVRLPDGFEIREPREEDVEALLAVDVALPAHQRGSPVFSERPLPTANALLRMAIDAHRRRGDGADRLSRRPARRLLVDL